MDMAQYLTQPTAVTHQPRPRLDYKVDMLFLIYILVLKDGNKSVCLTSQYQASSGHCIAGNTIVPEIDLIVK
jgi:hypothetical protein